MLPCHVGAHCEDGKRPGSFVGASLYCPGRPARRHLSRQTGRAGFHYRYDSACRTEHRRSSGDSCGIPFHAGVIAYCRTGLVFAVRRGCGGHDDEVGYSRRSLLTLRSEGSLVSLFTFGATVPLWAYRSLVSLCSLGTNVSLGPLLALRSRNSLLTLFSLCPLRALSSLRSCRTWGTVVPPFPLRSLGTYRALYALRSWRTAWGSRLTLWPLGTGVTLWPLGTGVTFFALLALFALRPLRSARVTLWPLGTGVALFAPFHRYHLAGLGPRCPLWLPGRQWLPEVRCLPLLLADLRRPEARLLPADLGLPALPWVPGDLPVPATPVHPDKPPPQAATWPSGRWLPAISRLLRLTFR